MGWLQKIFGGGTQPVLPKTEQQAKLDDAFEYGLKVAQSVDQALEQSMLGRFGHI